VRAFFEEISDAAARGETVKISSFGTFMVRAKAQRIGRNPKTGVEALIAPRRVTVFRPSPVLKARVNSARAAVDSEWQAAIRPTTSVCASSYHSSVGAIIEPNGIVTPRTAWLAPRHALLSHIC